MVLQKHFVTIGFLALLSIAGCSSHTQQKVVTKEETKKYYAQEEAKSLAVTNAAAKKAEAQNFVEIKFKPGSALLTKSAKSSIKTALKKAKKEGKIDEVIVLSWSDQAYPAESLKKLPKEQRELAEKRNKAVALYVKKIRSLEVDSYNMAERPTAFSKLFNTADSKLKDSFVAAGLSTTENAPNYASKASHSVLLIKVK